MLCDGGAVSYMGPFRDVVFRVEAEHLDSGGLSLKECDPRSVGPGSLATKASTVCSVTKIASPVVFVT
ncbi:hypothetical protein Mycsm_03553 [Mycobacterium sp. JS623]|nr:hypothetical protein Mycsm_03553 [Mycobacterium sp. JS623]